MNKKIYFALFISLLTVDIVQHFIEYTVNKNNSKIKSELSCTDNTQEEIRIQKFAEKNSASLKEISYLSRFDGKVIHFTKLEDGKTTALNVSSMAYTHEVCPNTQPEMLDVNQSNHQNNFSKVTNSCAEKQDSVNQGVWLTKNGAYCSAQQVFVLKWVNQTSSMGKNYMVPKYVIYDTPPILCQTLSDFSKQAYSPDEALEDSIIMEGSEVVKKAFIAY